MPLTTSNSHCASHICVLLSVMNLIILTVCLGQSDALLSASVVPSLDKSDVNNPVSDVNNGLNKLHAASQVKSSTRGSSPTVSLKEDARNAAREAFVP